MTSDAERLRGLWHKLKGRAKEQWGRLSDDQLTEIEGRMERLLGHLVEAYGLSHEDAKRQVEEWLKKEGRPPDRNG